MPTTDVVVVGGGIVGLATAAALLDARPGSHVVVLEKEERLGAHQTSHNSGVIHSGIYYRPGSLKARLCRAGYDALLRFCEEEGVAHELCGKLIVAVDEVERARLDELARRAEANGLGGVRAVGADEIREFEPHCAGIAGLHVPQTGIVDYAGVTEALGRRIARLGGEIHTGIRVESIREVAGGADVTGGGTSWRTRTVVTCAGLQSDRVASMTTDDLDLRIVPFRGEYFTLRPSAVGLVRGLIYPVPDPDFPFLGVHFTRLIHGGVECGPNAVLALHREGYSKFAFRAADAWDTLRWPGFRAVARRHWRTGLGEVYRSVSKRAFTRALQRLVPEVRSADLSPVESGIRAQACHRDGTLVDDFEIRGSGRVVHVCNAPSPAATASLAIGAHVAGHVLDTRS